MNNKAQLDSLPESNSTLPKRSLYKRVLIVGVLLVLLLVITTVFFLKRSKNLLKKPPIQATLSPTVEPVQAERLNKPIVKIGKETIYQKDLEYEKRHYPSVSNVDVDKILLDKLINDSIILQEGKKNNFVNLDETLFNSQEKDYEERIHLVEKVKREIDNRVERIEGHVVSIWFNNIKPASIGYEEGRKFAFQKISRLSEDVKSGRMTIQEAGEFIKNDKSLAQVDPVYQGNAIFDFSVTPDEKITFDEGFDKILKSLNEQEVSDVYLAKDKGYSDKYIDSVYMFGQISKKVQNAEITTDFDSWVSEAKNNYEIEYY